MDHGSDPELQGSTRGSAFSAVIANSTLRILDFHVRLHNTPQSRDID